MNDSDLLDRIARENPQTLPLATWALEIIGTRTWDQLTPDERHQLQVLNNTIWEIYLRYIDGDGKGVA